MASHCGEPDCPDCFPFRCSVCGRTSRTKAGLAQHTRTHESTLTRAAAGLLTPDEARLLVADLLDTLDDLKRQQSGIGKILEGLLRIYPDAEPDAEPAAPC